MIVKNPIVADGACILIERISSDIIISLYRENLGIDISHYFKGIKEVQINRCLTTGYRFYTPLNIEGNIEFYEYLGEFDWYYMPWKWEHQKSLKYIKHNDLVLEIGCGKGDYLKYLMSKGIYCLGLESNILATTKGKANGIEIRNEDIESFSVKNFAKYDVVCSFQVLEHISAVHEFLRSQIKCLKKGGKLIISVPNNNSILHKRIGSSALNMPPHHMGLWDKNSLKKLSVVFPELIPTGIFCEPLQDYHFNLFYIEWLKRYIDPFWGIRSLIYRTKMELIFKGLLRRFANKLIGHTIFAVYIKK